jgi:hypothetical protein
MHKTTVFENQIPFTVFDTQFGLQGMENIGEIWYCLVPFLTQRGPYCVLVLVDSNRVVLFFNESLKESHVGETDNIADFSMVIFSEQLSHQSLTWGMALRSEKVIFSLSEKLWIEKYPSSRFNHLSTTFTSISPSNNGISKFTCTLKGVAWLLDEDASPVGSHRRIYENFSIISFLCHARDSSSNISKGSPAPSYFFSSPMGFFGAQHDRSCKGSTGSSPNFLYPDFVRDMHKEKYLKSRPL